MRSQSQLRNDKIIMLQYTNWINSTPSQQKLLSCIAQWLEHSVCNRGVASSSPIIGILDMCALSYLSVFLRCRISDELVGKLVIRKASWIKRSNEFDFHELKSLITFPVMQLLYLDLFELCYTDLRQYVWVPRQNKIKWIVQFPIFCCGRYVAIFVE